jgi:hypothetical protein
MNAAESSPVILNREVGEGPYNKTVIDPHSWADMTADVRSLSVLRRIGMTAAFGARCYA